MCYKVKQLIIFADKKPKFVMPPYPLINFEIQKYYQNETKFNCVYSGKNLPKINGAVWVINLYEYKSIGTHLIAL